MDGWMVEEDDAEVRVRSSECGMSEGVEGRVSGGEGGEDEGHDDEDEHDVGDSEMGVLVSEADAARMAAERAAEKSGSGASECGWRVGG